MEPQANAVRNRHHKGHELQREGHEDAKLEAQCAERALLQEIVRAPGEPYADHASGKRRAHRDIVCERQSRQPV
jgi:hypothetical protein